MKFGKSMHFPHRMQLNEKDATNGRARAAERERGGKNWQHKIYSGQKFNGSHRMAGVYTPQPF